jgi:hypothetical protein
MAEIKTTNKLKLAIAKAKKEAPTMHYVAKIVCTNCLEDHILTIPKGITVGDYAMKKLCENCGCTFIGEYDIHE